MIKKSCIKKMHKEIEGLLSETERTELFRYLETNPEAKTLYEELSQTAQLLGDMPRVEPSPNIKKYILNSINPNRYASVRRSAKTESFFAPLLAKPSTRLAFAFSLGSVIGIFIYAAITQEPSFQHSINSTKPYGTIGVSDQTDSNNTRNFPITASGINGSVTVTKGEESIALWADLKAAQPIDIFIEYDTASLNYSGFSTRSPKISLDASLNDIRISAIGDVQFGLHFLNNNDVFDVTLKFYQDGKCIDRQDISF